MKSNIQKMQKTLGHYWQKNFKSSEFGTMLFHSMIYLIGSALNAGLQLISLPIFTRLLSEREYGIYSLFFSSTSLVVVPLTLNMNGALSRYLIDKPEEKSTFIGASVLLTTLALLITTPFYYFFSENIAVWLGVPQSLSLSIYLAAVGSAYSILFANILLGLRKSASFSLYNFSVRILVFLGGLIGLYFFGGSKGLIDGQVYSWVFVLLIALVALKKEADFKLLKKHVFFILNYSFPLIPYLMGGVLLGQLDRVLLAGHSGLEETAIYSVASNIGALLMLVGAAFQSSAGVDQIRMVNEGRIEDFHRLTLRALKIQLFFAGTLIVFSDYLVMLLAGKKYLGATKALLPIIWGNVFLIFRSVQCVGLSYNNSTVWFSILAIGSGLLNAIGNQIFIPKYGFMASAYVSVFSYFVYFLSSWAVSKYFLRFPTVSNLNIFLYSTPIIVVSTGSALSSGSSLFSVDILLLKGIMLGISGLVFFLGRR